MINLALSTVAWIFGGFETFKYVLIIFGFCVTILIKEVNAKNEYLFYYNNGISKVHLVLYAFIMNFIFSVALILVINLILKLI